MLKKKKIVSGVVNLRGHDFKISVLKKNLTNKKKNLVLAEAYGSDKIKKLNWYQKGYDIIDVFSKSEHLKNTKKINKYLAKILKIKKKKSFNVINYHKFINDKNHLEIVKQTRNLDPQVFKSIKKKIFLKIFNKYEISFKKNKILGKEVAILRLNRPGGIKDLNPPHRDGYLNYWAKSLNIWYMISGSFNSCSLPIVPKSHLYNEKYLTVTKPRCFMNGIKYNVPTILKITGKKKIFFKIPKLKPGQVLVFSPFLIHGFGYNFSKKKTRSALEFRPMVS
tara:strand:+ start:373 stop:1209 length:837 start_codon:yes stop_codon:yes gene_type:complete